MMAARCRYSTTMITPAITTSKMSTVPGEEPRLQRVEATPRPLEEPAQGHRPFSSQIFRSGM